MDPTQFAVNETSFAATFFESAFLRPLLSRVGQLQPELERSVRGLLESCGGECETGRARLPGARMDEVARRLDAWPEGGLELGAQLGRAALGVIEFLMRSSSSVSEAFRTLERFDLLLGTSTRVRLLESADRLTVELCPVTPRVRDWRLLNEVQLGWMLWMVGELTGGAAHAARLWFSHPPSKRAQEVQGAVAQEQMSCGFVLTGASLRVPVASADPALFRVLVAAAESECLGIPRAEDFSAQVRVALQRCLDGQPLTLGRVARKLAVSSRTLQRRVCAEGTTFYALVDEVRETAAKHHLAGASLSQAEIAWLLGFADQASFSRAFKRWTGLTPGGFRAQASGAAEAPRPAFPTPPPLVPLQERGVRLLPSPSRN